MLEYQSIFTRLIKYLLEGVAVAVAATILSRRSLSYQEIALIALTAALTFFLLDSLAPSIGFSARTGAGFGLGSNLVGFPAALPGAAMGVAAPIVASPLIGGGCGESGQSYQVGQVGGGYGESGQSYQVGQNQVGGNQITEATGVDATSDAKALPADYNYGPEKPVLITPQDQGPPTLESARTCTLGPTACSTSSPLFTQPINSCDCSLNCQPQCQPELTCPVSCPLGQTVFPNCNIASNNSPYKIVPGMFSHQIVLPGYNECVKPYNYYETPLGNN